MTIKTITKNGRLITILLMLVISIFLVLQPKARRDYAPPAQTDVTYYFEKCKVLSTDDYDLEEDPEIKGLYIGRQKVKLMITSGMFAGKEVEIDNAISRMYNYRAKKGMTMVVGLGEKEGMLVSCEISSYSRDFGIYVLIAAFVLVLIVIGRSKGFYAIISLLFTSIVVVFYMIPTILNGNSPIFAALLTSVVATAATIAMVSGFNAKSAAAVFGISLGLLTATLVGVLAGSLLKISGLNMENSEEMIWLARDSKLLVSEILFAGIIISSLGAIMDVGMSIASAVYEVYSADKSQNTYSLYKSGMNVGRDVMGTMTNTLILAFAGSSISTLIIMYMYSFPYNRFMNLNVLGIEIIQGIAGSIGLVMTVPSTAWIAALLIKRIKASEKA